MNQLKILMLGASLQQRGGIAAVEKLIMKHMGPEVELHHIATHDEGTIAHRVRVFSIAIFKLFGLFSVRNINVVHIHVSERGSIVRKIILIIICFLLRKPILLHTHGAEFHLFYEKLNVFARRLISFTFRKCQGFVVLSKNWRDFYIDRLRLREDKVFLLYNPIEIHCRPTKKTENKKQVQFVFMGRIGDRKGAFDVLRAFARLPMHLRENSTVTLAGDGDITHGKEIIASMKLGNRILFSGWIDDVQKAELFSKADVFLLPSYNEGLPMAILEAMSWGLPVIASSVAGIPDIIRERINGLLIKPGNISQLAEGMKLLIEDEPLRIKMGNAAKRTSERFDVKYYCSALKNIYLSIVESRGAQAVNAI